MFATAPIRTFVTVVTVAAVALWAGPALAGGGGTPKPIKPPPRWGQQDGRTVSQGLSLDDPSAPEQANPDVRPPGCDTTRVDTVGLTHFPTKHGHTGVWGVEGANKDVNLIIEIDNNPVADNTKHLWIQFDVRVTPGSECRPSASGTWGPGQKNPSVKQRGTYTKVNLPNGWERRTYEWSIKPQPWWETIKIRFRTNNDPAASVLIDNLFVYTHCYGPDSKVHSHGYGFGDSSWPPEPFFEETEPWYQGTDWNAYGSYPPEWMPGLTDHEGVIGLPAGIGPADGVLAVRFDDLAEPEGVKRVACQFDFYMAEGGNISWEQETPPGTTIENLHETVIELDNGWQSCLVTFDVTPPPDWEEFRWLMFTERGGPVAIDNVIVSAAPISQGDWSEEFEFYQSGSGLHGQGGWKGWDNDPAFDAPVTEVQARSPWQSVEIADDADLVREFEGATSGEWQFTAWMYVPADFESNCDPYGNCGSYFLLLNTYNDGGPYHWSVQLRADSITDSFIRDGVTPASLPLITDQWVKIEVLIDLDNDFYQVFYDGVELGQAESWTAGVNGGGGGALNIGAVDLFANGSPGRGGRAAAIHYDDLNLELKAPKLVIEKHEQNKKTGKITAKLQNGVKSQFSEPTSTDPNVVTVDWYTTSNVEGGARLILEYTKQGPGHSFIMIETTVGEAESIFVVPNESLFSVSVSGGADFGQVHASQIPPGRAAMCTLMIVDIFTGEPDPLANGLARVALTDSSAFTFDGEVQYQEIEFINGLAEAMIFSDGPAGELGFLEISDTDGPLSVGGPEILYTDRISLTTDWTDNFDAYAPGSLMHGQGGWKGWDNDPAFDAFVTDAVFSSEPHSVDIAGPSDLVHEFSQVDSGQWVFSAWQYIPGDFTSGSGPLEPGTYFLLLNTYNDGGPYHWSVQMNFDSNDGMLKVYHGNGYNTVDVPYVPDEWIEISIKIDLDIDSCTVYYDGEFIVEYSWTGGIFGGGGGAANIAAIDLFANASSSVYYDDLWLRSVIPLGDLNCDGVLNAFDIDPFVLALTNPDGYAAAYPDCDRMLADINADGVVDAFDIDPFVELLTGG